LAAAAAFVICMGAVWGAEKVIGNSLSCGIWANCPCGAVPGIHPAGYDGTGAGSSILGGGVNTGGVERPSLVDRVRQNRTRSKTGTRFEMANPSLGIRGAAHHQPLPTRALRREQEARNLSHRTRDKNPFHRTQDRNPPRRRLESGLLRPAPHRQPTSNFARTGSLSRSAVRVVGRSEVDLKG
jgi:hypothetical protein